MVKANCTEHASLKTLNPPSKINQSLASQSSFFYIIFLSGATLFRSKPSLAVTKDSRRGLSGFASSSVLPISGLLFSNPKLPIVGGAFASVTGGALENLLTGFLKLEVRVGCGGSFGGGGGGGRSSTVAPVSGTWFSSLVEEEITLDSPQRWRHW